MKKNPIKKEIYWGLEELPIPKRCDNEQCRLLIPNTGSFVQRVLDGKKLVFCDEWCADQQCYKKRKVHDRVCKSCGGQTEEYMRYTTKGQLYGHGSFRKYCSTCRPYRRGKILENLIELKKSIDK